MEITDPTPALPYDGRGDAGFRDSLSQMISQRHLTSKMTYEWRRGMTFWPFRMLGDPALFSLPVSFSILIFRGNFLFPPFCEIC